jgi:hypothetical protein
MNKYTTGPLLGQARRCLLVVKLLYFTDLPLCLKLIIDGRGAGRDREN